MRIEFHSIVLIDSVMLREVTFLDEASVVNTPTASVPATARTIPSQGIDQLRWPISVFRSEYTA